MKANFQTFDPEEQQQANNYATSLSKVRGGLLLDTNRPPPIGYESFTCVDAVGSEFVWMNEAFPKEKFTWYLWFESVFLVTEDMVAFLRLREQ